MMLISMLCWGSWANTQKIDKAWRFGLFYWDYMWGILVCALLFGFTLGRTNPAARVSFFHNLASASARSLIKAFAGGMIFNLGNLLLVAAISVAGMAVAFPLGAGLALVIGAILNYVVSPAGLITNRQPWDQFSGLMDEHQSDAIKEVIEWAPAWH